MKENIPHVAFFGKRNVGKSSLINCLVKEEISIVSPIAGTTTDVVRKRLEIPGIGPCLFMDTAGYDEDNDLGFKRVERSKMALEQIDLAILLISDNSWDKFEDEWISFFEDKKIPFLIVFHKVDLKEPSLELWEKAKALSQREPLKTHQNLQDSHFFFQVLLKALPETCFEVRSLVGDLVHYGSFVVLITPVDIEAPQGRLILPQVQTIRSLLDEGCVSCVLRERELEVYSKMIGKDPDLVITDSQVFMKASSAFKEHIPLTSFSILLARYKGDFSNYVQGTPQIDSLKQGARILILESCSHHSGADDIGRVKIPRLLENYTGKKFNFEFVSGLHLPSMPWENYDFLIQCGGCMLTRRQIMQRTLTAVQKGVPISNYGMTIAYCLGIFERAVRPFVKIDSSLDLI